MPGRSAGSSDRLATGVTKLGPTTGRRAPGGPTASASRGMYAAQRGRPGGVAAVVELVGPLEGVDAAPRSAARRRRSAAQVALTSPVCSIACIPIALAACRPAISGCCSGSGHGVAHVTDAERAQQRDDLARRAYVGVDVVEVRDDADRVQEALRRQVAGGQGRRRSGDLAVARRAGRRRR